MRGFNSLPKAYIGLLEGFFLASWMLVRFMIKFGFISLLDGAFIGGEFMSDVATKERTKNVVVENEEKYELLDTSTFKKVKCKVLKEYKHVFEELAKWLGLH